MTKVFVIKHGRYRGLSLHNLFFGYSGSKSKLGRPGFGHKKDELGKEDLMRRLKVSGEELYTARSFARFWRVPAPAGKVSGSFLDGDAVSEAFSEVLLNPYI